MNIAEILRDPGSRYFLIPLATAILGVVAKISGQNDRIKMQRPIELFYLSPNLLAANFILIICEFEKILLIEAEKQQAFSDACLSALLINIGATFGLILWVRKLGWNHDTGHMKPWLGVIIPDILTVIVMYFVFKTLSL